jgi:hypothetical protein
VAPKVVLVLPGFIIVMIVLQNQLQHRQHVVHIQHTILAQLLLIVDGADIEIVVRAKVVLLTQLLLLAQIILGCITKTNVLIII